MRHTAPSLAYAAIVEPLALLLAPMLVETSLASDLELGEYLSAQCMSCHQVDGRESGGVPAIAGWPWYVTVAALEQYRDGTRTNAVMRSVAQGLAPDEMQAVAAWFEQLHVTNPGGEKQQ